MHLKKKKEDEKWYSIKIQSIIQIKCFNIRMKNETGSIAIDIETDII